MSRWKPIPTNAVITLSGLGKEEVLFPQDDDPDFIQRGTITLDGVQIRADIGFREWVSGPGGVYHEYEPITYKEVT